MKKIIASLLVLVIATAGMAQPYFQATMRNSGNTLTISIKPVGGDIVNKRFSAMEFFVRYPNTAPSFTFSAPVVDPAFSGINFTVKGPNLYGSETGFTNYVFEWIGGATAVPASPTTYTNGTEYTVFSVNLVGPANVTDIDLVHNTNQSPTYINISDNVGNSLSCIDNFGTTIGNAFYGTGFFTGASTAGGTDHVLPLSAVPIPVKFTTFSAVRKDNNGVLNWQVENESVVTDKYLVERSFNGRDFNTINTLAARTNGTTGSNAYVYTDVDLKSLRSDIIYYRIKQLDKDGKFAYTEIRSIRLDGKSFAASVFPNPVVGVANVNIDLIEDAKVNIILTDAAGKEIQKALIEGKEGQNIYKLNMSTVASGTYQLKVSAGNESKVISIIKNK